MIQQGAKKIYSVSEINYFAKQTLEQMDCWVEGEVSSYEENPAWFNTFLTLSDSTNTLPCFLKPELLNTIREQIIGKKVIAYGHLTLFKKNQYKLEIFSIEQSGEGILQKRFEILYKKLKKEGLFEEKNKKSLPLYPKKICIVTSEGSAGWNDFKSHTQDKFPIIELDTADIRVEGPRAKLMLLQILPQIDRRRYDLIVLTRGGGAAETLLEVFNDEAVVRAISKMVTPKIIAIGHEINTTLAELAADKRASTPTDAANIATFGYANILDKLAHISTQLNTLMYKLFSENGQLLDSAYFHLNQIKTTFKNLPHQLASIKEALRRHEKSLIADIDANLRQAQLRMIKEAKLFVKSRDVFLENKRRDLLLLSPTNTLQRGYSITTDTKGKILRSVENVVVGSTIGVRLSDGSIKSTVKTKLKA